jgi:hypothetical protein
MRTVSSGNGEAHYRVHLSGLTAKGVRQIQRRATREGRGREVIEAFREAIKRLKRDPMNFGEPAYRLPALRLYVRRAAIRPLLIDFAVSEDWLLVFIKGVKLLAR